MQSSEKPFNEIDFTVSGARILWDTNYSSALFTSKYLFGTLQWFEAHLGVGSENLFVVL